MPLSRGTVCENEVDEKNPKETVEESGRSRRKKGREKDTEKKNYQEKNWTEGERTERAGMSSQ